MGARAAVFTRKGKELPNCAWLCEELWRSVAPTSGDGGDFPIQHQRNRTSCLPDDARLRCDPFRAGRMRKDKLSGNPRESVNGEGREAKSPRWPKGPC